MRPEQANNLVQSFIKLSLMVLNTIKHYKSEHISTVVATSIEIQEHLTHLRDVVNAKRVALVAYSNGISKPELKGDIFATIKFEACSEEDELKKDVQQLKIDFAYVEVLGQVIENSCVVYNVTETKGLLHTILSSRDFNKAEINYVCEHESILYVLTIIDGNLNPKASSYTILKLKNLIEKL